MRIEDEVARLVEVALAEDVGAGDLTVEATVPEGTTATARIIQRRAGVIFGVDTVDEVFRRLGGVRIEWLESEGEWRDGPATIARLEGDARSILIGERTALNFLGHLSGVATMTARLVDAVRGTGARILDTRKTTPGMRLLEKAAVRAGGGVNHRTGLFDAVLIKENHIALAGDLGQAVAVARRAVAARRAGTDAGEPVPGPGFDVEIECETLEQVHEAIAAGADRILLDNMDLDTMREAVAIRDREAGVPRRRPNAAAADPDPAAGGVVSGRVAEGGVPDGLLLEASGGITLESVRAVAETGVDLISSGSLTHSSPALDLTMLIEFDS